MQNVITLENISKTYNTGKTKVQALKNIYLNVEKGDFLSIVGASGSGKSTLMNIIGCLDTADEGNYFLLDKNVSLMKEKTLSELRRKSIGFIFQKFNLIPTLDAFENVSLPLIYSKTPKKDREIRVEKALDAVGLLSRANHKPSELSGGQQQRVAIARAIVTEPEILLADEPTGNLDRKNADEVLELLLHTRRTIGQTLVMVTHDMKIAKRADRVLIMENGNLLSRNIDFDNL